MSDFRIRMMRPDEISTAVDWAAGEGWNPGLADAPCFAVADPQGFLIGELDGSPAATVSCVNYGASFATKFAGGRGGNRFHRPIKRKVAAQSADVSEPGPVAFRKRRHRREADFAGLGVA